MDTVTLTIDGLEITAEAGTNLLDVAKRSGMYVPHLCHHSDLDPVGVCRLCAVHIEGRGLVMSCMTPVADGLVILTSTPETERERRVATQLLMADGHSDCRACGANGDCELQRVGSFVGIKTEHLASLRHTVEPLPIDTSNPFFDFDPNTCVLCGICVRTCDEIVGVNALDFTFRGTDTQVSAFFNQPLVESRCVSCGECVKRCPVGSLTHKRFQQPTREVKTVCPYCGVGCGMYLGVRGNQIVSVRGDATSQSNNGVLCVKGRYGQEFVGHSDRLTMPLVRRNGVLEETTWDEALDYVAERLSEYVGDTFGKLCSSKTTNEDGYIQQKFARLVMQTNNVDHCARLCHSPSVVAMMTALGSGATSNSYVDYEEAGCLLVVGSDPSTNHPVLASRMRRAIAERGTKLIVINPKRIDMCEQAELWLRPRPGTDVALLNAIARVILEEGLSDEEFVRDRTEGSEEWREVVDKYTLQYAEEITGVPSEDIARAARIYARPPAPLGSTQAFGGSCLLWGMGITQHTMGTANAHSLVNLALVAGQLGKPGNGISPLRGQNNVQGCGDSGCLPNLLPGYQLVGTEGAGRFEEAWGSLLPPKPGMTLTAMVEAALEGQLKAMYITGENPLLSEPDLHHTEKALRNLEFVVVQDVFLHETAQMADVVLPATVFAEKDGTFTNSERRVQRVRKAVNGPGQSRPDWLILSEVARRVSERQGLGLESQFAYTHPSEIWDEMAGLMPAVAGITYGRLEEEGGVQWPCPTVDHPGTRYLYEKDFPRGPRAKFVPFEQGPAAAELPGGGYPLALTTGRVLYHWHGGTITRRSPGLMERAPEVEVSINPEDGERYAVGDGDLVRLTSRRGEMEARAVLTDRMRRGEVFVPFVKLQEHAANFLTNAVFDPTARIPEYKACAIRIEKVTGPARPPRTLKPATVR